MQALIEAIMRGLAALFSSLSRPSKKPVEEPEEPTQDDPVVVPPVFHKNPTKTYDIAHIKKWEALRLKAYVCPAGAWTIGYGHTKTAKPGMVITEEEANRLLRWDLDWAEEAVRDAVKVDITQPQFDALVSFTFNLGAGALYKSTLLRKLNAGDYEGAAREFKRWNKGGGKVLQGLVNRRAEEERMFRSGM